MEAQFCHLGSKGRLDLVTHEGLDEWGCEKINRRHILQWCSCCKSTSRAPDAETWEGWGKRAGWLKQGGGVMRCGGGRKKGESWTFTFLICLLFPTVLYHETVTPLDRCRSTQGMKESIVSGVSIWHLVHRRSMKYECEAVDLSQWEGYTQNFLLGMSSSHLWYNREERLGHIYLWAQW